MEDIKTKIYAVYKKDELLFVGTAKEAEKFFNVKRKTIYFWSTPANKRRRNLGKECGGRKIAISFDDDE